MDIFVVEVFDDTGSQCVFYTVRWEGSEETETDKFFQKFENEKHLEQPLLNLVEFLESFIANKTGALDSFFRFENVAQGLPPSGNYQIREVWIDYVDFPLRLYCLKITEHLVVLFNGNEKTSQTAQDGKTSMDFHNANQFAKRITKALNDKDIIVSENQRALLYFDNSLEILL